MKKMLHKGFNSPKCKTSLKMAVSRIKILRNMKDIQLKQLRREIAQLLENGQDQTAKIRIEHVVREEKTIAAYDLIDVYCELIAARLPIIESQKNCPIDLKEAISSVIFASPRCSDIPELMDVRKHFTAKYGKDFVNAAIELRPDSGVARILIEKLSTVSPNGPTKVKILTEIAEAHNIKWEPNWSKDNEPEPPAHVQNEPNINRISMMHEAPTSFQAAPSFEPKQEVSSDSYRIAGSLAKHPDSAYPAARPSGTEAGTVQFTGSTGGVEDVSSKVRQKYNMEFRDANAAANAAAESAELASMAARAAAELASHGKFTGHTTADPKFYQGEVNKDQLRYAKQDAPVDKLPENNSFHGGSSTRGHPQRDNDRVKISASHGKFTDHTTADPKFYRGEVNKDQFRYAKQDAPVDKLPEDNSFHGDSFTTGHMQRDNAQVKISEMNDENSFKDELHQSVEHDAYRQYVEKESPREAKQKVDQKHSIEPDVECETGHESLPEDPEFSRTSSFQVASHHDHDIFSYSDHRHEDDSAVNPFSEAMKSGNDEPSSFRSHSGDLGENYGVTSGPSGAKYDSDPDEDPFGSIGQVSFSKEDIETKEPFHSSVSQDPLDVFYAFSEQKYGSDSYKHHSVHTDEWNDGGIHKEKESTVTSATDAPPCFDDYVADEDEYLQSAGRKSPDYSPSKLYEPEVTQSFRKSPLYLQLVKPVSLGDDSDSSNSENEEEIKEHRITDTSSSRKGLHSPPLVPEQPSTKEHPEESIEKEYKESARQKYDSEHLSTAEDYSGRVRTNSDAKSFDRHSFSRILEEAERLSSPRASSLRTTPDVTDDSQHIYQSNTESRTELNVESLTGGLRNKGQRRPPYTRDTPSYSSSSSLPTSDNTHESYKTSTPFSSEINELSSQKDIIREKKTSNPYDDGFAEDAELNSTISVQSPSEKRDSSRGSQFYFGSEDISSTAEVVNETTSTLARPVARSSRRTKASGPSYVSGLSSETKPSDETSSALKSDSKKKYPSSPSTAVDASIRPNRRHAIQMQSLEPQRREEDKTRPSHFSKKISSGEEISASSVPEKKQTNSRNEGTSGPEVTDVPTTKSNASEKTLLRDSSDKKASHVHPKLPDYDDFASHFLSLKKNRQQ